MKLMVQSWNNGGSAYNAEAEETNFLHYEINHRMDEPAEAIIILMDPTGTMAQKYANTANDVYLLAGKVTIEDPNGTDIFFGRIMKATGDMADRTLTLYCQDWLSQLDNEQIEYDMREDLDGAGLRTSVFAANYAGTNLGPCYTSGVPKYYYYDRTMAWAVNKWDGFYTILPNSIAGSVTMRTGPYDKTTGSMSGGETDDDAPENLWVDDTSNDTTADDLADATVDYTFYSHIGDYTNLVSVDSAKVTGRISWYDIDYGTQTVVKVQIYDYTAAQWRDCGTLPNASSTTSDVITNISFDVPTPYLDDMSSGAGLSKVRFKIDRPGGAAGSGWILNPYYLMLEMTCTTTGYSTAISIIDTPSGTTNEVGTDLKALYLWEGCPYAIAQEIYKHIESATGPVLGYDSMVTLTCGAANVENTSGISTRQYSNKTPLEILQDLAIQDKAHFWITLGGTTVTYKSTFNNGAPETLTDGDVLHWVSVIDGQHVANKAIVEGMRIGDEQLQSTYSDAASIAVYNCTRTKIRKDTGLVSEYDTLAKATALVNQYKDVQRILLATIPGNTLTEAHAKTLKLGDEVSITSTYLGLAASVYVVQAVSFNSHPSQNMTTLRLHPRVSTVGMQKPFASSMEVTKGRYLKGSSDSYVPVPSEDVI